jgi:pimeloyl-ACP methyl ester carboxylesterase
LFYGDGDAVAPVAHGKRLAAAYGPAARLTTLRGATHLTLGVKRALAAAVGDVVLG